MNANSRNSRKTEKGGRRATFPRCFRGLSTLPLIAVLALPPLPAAATQPDPWKIGVEGRAEAILNRGDYLPRPLDDRTPLVLRLGAVTPAENGGFHYEFHYLGLEPGDYRLADYLILPDGSAATGAGDATLSVRGILPADHDGALAARPLRPFPRLGGYRRVAAAAGVLWFTSLIVIARAGRRKAVVPAPAPPPPAPGYAERMRPLLEAAAADGLDAVGQAELERLLTGYWREKLAAPGVRVPTAFAQLRAHPEAGGLIRDLERWLHRPGGADAAEIERILAPYHNLAAATGKEAGA